LLAAKTAACRIAIVNSMERAKVALATRTALQEMVDAVHTLSDDPSPANVERYLASSRALERSRNQSAERKGRHARKTRDPVHS
jgi:hypothetical protein